MPMPLEARPPSPRATPASPRTPIARGEGRRHTPTSECIAAPHPAPLPAKAGKGDWAALVATGEPDPNGPIWQESAFRKDVWAKAAENEPLPDGPAIVSKKRWLAERDGLAGRNP